MLSIPAQDYWWYLRLGRDILATRAMPLLDTMGYSRGGQPIYYQQWLAGILFWLTYKLGGITLTFLLRGLLIGLSHGMLWGWPAVSRSATCNPSNRPSRSSGLE